MSNGQAYAQIEREHGNHPVWSIALWKAESASGLTHLDYVDWRADKLFYSVKPTPPHLNNPQQNKQKETTMNDETKIDDGGNAFPLPAMEGYHQQEYGMILRDWFAGQAIACAVDDYGEPSSTSSAGQRRDRGNPILSYATQGSGTREQIIARQAYKYADAMIAERNK